MKRRKDPRHLASPGAVLRAAAAAGVEDMSVEDRREWLQERGWTSLDWIRARLDARRAAQTGGFRGDHS